ncbi:esterase/lipase family protein [Nodularia sp. NIES-3585]|uniref:esterase/lipase family protein n=1 Tax=Nodularia sp. NIES-3585 TaxID=1973477 RepID=UPI000B5C9241|nr:hypothetical protein [Nodularia sp. NIES-3585]GAX35712.1 hypothetical protein NIES3585_17300 [Nodularia sp. NIES-3585]
MNQLNKSDFDQTGLHQIKNCNKFNRRADIIFVHGLTGHAITTWHPEEKCDENCWPFWLGDENEFKNIGIWSFGYKANLIGRGMSIYQQANSLLNSLKNEVVNGIGTQQIIFITHSLGGLVIKEMLEIACTTIDPKSEIQKITNQVKGIVFLASPHQGSHLANIFNVLNLNILNSVIILQLRANNSDSSLTKLNASFAQKIQQLSINVRVFYETEAIKRTFGIIKVVNPDSAIIPGISIDKNEGVQANHINIAKPIRTGENKGDNVYNAVYKGVRTFIRECLNQNPQ